MKHLFLSLMIKLPIIVNTLIMVFLSCLLFILLPHIKNYQPIDSKSFFTLTGITVALLAQIYFKLQDTKFIANASVSELNRIKNSVDIRARAVIKLIFFHIIFGIINFFAFSSILSEAHKTIVISIGSSFIILWTIGLLFGYLLYQELADLNSELLKRKMQTEQRQAKLKEFSS